MLPAPIRLVLIDDHQMLLEALSARLSRDSGLQVIGTASNCDAGLELVVQTAPDLLLMDVEIPGRGAFDLAGEILARVRQTKVVFLSGYLTDVFVAQALRVRASGYLLKGDSLDTLCEAIRRAVAGETVFSDEVRRRVTHDPTRKRYFVQTHSELLRLTPRQLEVLRHLARGQSVKEIATRMRLSEKSVDSHKYRIMAKLGLHDRVELARYAIREGLLLP